MKELFSVAEQFSSGLPVIDVREFGNGNINRTHLVTLDAPSEKHFILQRINAHVFKKPEDVLKNIRTCTDHIHNRLVQHPLQEGIRWEIPRILCAGNGKDHWTDEDGSFWRALSFIEDAESFEVVRDSAHAFEVGRALGIFHSLLSDLQLERLVDTLEGFHVTPRYLEHYDRVLSRAAGSASAEDRYCREFILTRRENAGVLEKARVSGLLYLRPIHGDPKVNNVLIDSLSGKAAGIVDLDTVKPGLIHYDIGDCLRSACNPLGEETEQLTHVMFDTDICHCVLQGYLSKARPYLSENDFFFIFDSARLISFELGLRFFTDYLESDTYFRVTRPGQNLSRALVQFRLTESIEAQESAIRSIIRELR